MTNAKPATEGHAFADGEFRAITMPIQYLRILIHSARCACFVLSASILGCSSQPSAAELRDSEARQLQSYQESRRESVVGRADALYQAGYPERAITELDQLALEADASLEVLWRQALLRAEQHDFLGAASAIERMIVADPTLEYDPTIEAFLIDLEAQSLVVTRSEPNAQPEAPHVRDSKQRRRFQNSLGMEFVAIPPGIFVMGSANERTTHSDLSETPHGVTLTKAFLLGCYEVTQQQWQAVMGSTVQQQHAKMWGGTSEYEGGNEGIGADYPMYFVNWTEATEFCRRLSEREGKVYRLPTEAEWEYACRAGTSGPHAGNVDQMAWYKTTSGGSTQRVGLKSPNAWGLYDMHGNVIEWCADWFGDYSQESTVDPAGPRKPKDFGPMGVGRVLRGGCWNWEAEDCRSASRIFGDPKDEQGWCGFRVVLEQ